MGELFTESKKCKWCKKVKPISEYRKISYTDRRVNHCITCHREYARERYDAHVHNRRDSACEHEVSLVDYLRTNGIFAFTGKAMNRSRYVDIIAMGCVFIEAKLGEVRPRNPNQHVFRFSLTQQNEGIRGDVVCLIMNTSTILYALIIQFSIGITARLKVPLPIRQTRIIG